MLPPLTLFLLFVAGSACIGSQQEAKPGTHFRTWNISEVANLQIIAAVKAIFAATENERTVTGMAEYIEREAAIAALDEFRLNETVSKYATVMQCRAARDAISRATKALESLPAADVEPVKRGRWIYNIESGECVCSACGENALSFKIDTLYDVDLYETCLTDYCPNCGARMVEEVKHER